MGLAVNYPGICLPYLLNNLNSSKFITCTLLFDVQLHLNLAYTRDYGRVYLGGRRHAI